MVRLKLEANVKKVNVSIGPLPIRRPEPLAMKSGGDKHEEGFISAVGDRSVGRNHAAGDGR